jgi:hypothetical protein
VLKLTESFAEALPNLDSVASQRGESLGARFGRAIVDGLSSSKTDIRSASESLIRQCVKHGVLSAETVKKSASRLKPAQQRTIGPIIAKIASAVGKSGEPTGARESAEEQSISKPAARTTAPPRPRNSILQKSINSKVTEVLKSEAGNTKHHERQPVERNSAVTNPLVANVGSVGIQKSRAAMRSMTWPEYPEEPSGLSSLNALKKAWSPLLPPESTKKLFPDGGIRKQDDAVEGCELLSRAIVMERSGEGLAILEQFSLILRWAVFVMCSKESPVGLQALLQFLSDLVDFLRETKYELSDAEASLIVPAVFDKASVAKVRKPQRSCYTVIRILTCSILLSQGRFKDVFMDLVEQLKSDDLLPPKRMGPLVCVSVIEGSSHPKARLMACRECYECVEKIGLSGIGKKGVLAAAKSFSEEKLQENRHAFLELMVLLLSRMNGDMQRFTRICGSSLSGKARSLIEERVKEGGKDAVPSKRRSSVDDPSSANDAGSRRLSRLPNPAKSTPSKLPDIRSNNTPKPMQSIDNVDGESVASFQDELPALDLRAGLRDTPSAPSGIPRPSAGSAVRPIKLLQTDSSFPSAKLGNDDASSDLGLSSISSGADDSLIRDDVEDILAKEENDSRTSTNLFATSAAFQPEQSSLDASAGPVAGENLGAAASLRARLMKIRQKNKTTTEELPGVEDQAAHLQQPHAEERAELSSLGSNILRKSGNGAIDSVPVLKEPEPVPPVLDENKMEAIPIETPFVGSVGSTIDSIGHLDRYLEIIRRLLCRQPPLDEEDEGIIETTDALKTIHAAVSQQSNLAVDLDAGGVSQLRSEIMDKANEVVETLTR